jgi:hypothetical protein
LAEPGDKPAVMVDRAGAWLSEQLDGFEWLKSRRDLRRRRDGTEFRIHLQPSSWSRAGVAAWVAPRLSVLDDAVQQWREAHARSDASGVAWVYNTLLVNISPRWGSVECSGLPQPAVPNAPTPLALDVFASDLREEVVPVLEVFRDPETAARQLPQAWLSMISAGTIEWALAHDKREAATQLLRRHIERPVKGDQTSDPRVRRFANGWHARERPDDPLGGLESMGWLSREFNLIAPTDLTPSLSAGSARPSRPLRWRRLGRDR